MTTREFLLLVRWADTARSDSDFWQRIRAGSVAYSVEMQAAILELIIQMTQDDQQEKSHV